MNLLEKLYDMAWWALNEGRSEFLTKLIAESPQSAAILDDWTKARRGLSTSVNPTAEILECLMDCDPTRNKSYSDWIVRCFISSRPCRRSMFNEAAIASMLYSGLETLERLKELDKKQNLKELFDAYNASSMRKMTIQHLPANWKDLSGGYPPTSTLPILKFINDFRELKEPVKDIAHMVALQREADKDIDVIYEDDTWQIASPRSFAAASKLGNRTNWCTASSGGESQYNSRSSEGPLIVFINKNNREERYQFHWETRQFKNERNISIRHEEWLKDKPFLQKVYDWFLKNYPNKTEALFDLCPPEERSKQGLINFSKMTDVEREEYLEKVVSGKVSRESAMRNLKLGTLKIENNSLVFDINPTDLGNGYHLANFIILFGLNNLNGADSWDMSRLLGNNSGGYFRPPSNFLPPSEWNYKKLPPVFYKREEVINRIVKSVRSRSYQTKKTTPNSCEEFIKSNWGGVFEFVEYCWRELHDSSTPLSLNDGSLRMEYVYSGIDFVSLLEVEIDERRAELYREALREALLEELRIRTGSKSVEVLDFGESARFNGVRAAFPLKNYEFALPGGFKAFGAWWLERVSNFDDNWNRTWFNVKTEYKLNDREVYEKIFKGLSLP